MQNPFETKNFIDSKKKSGFLEWEESAVDKESGVEELLDQQRESPKLGWLKFFLFFCFFILGYRIFSLQILGYENFSKLSENNRTRKFPLIAPRGLIYDINGQIIAQNSASFSLVAVPFDLPKNQIDLELEVKSLSALFSLDADKILNILIRNKQGGLTPVVVKRGLSAEESILFQTYFADFPGFSIQKNPTRLYPQKDLFSHILGYTGLISKTEKNAEIYKNYDDIDIVGKSGVEKQYEEYLHGENGQSLIEVDASGKLINIIGEDEAKPGYNAILNIDLELQKKFYDSLKNSRPSGSIKAAAVALNPKNGNILALVSLPGYDNNIFSGGLSDEEYSILFDDANLPLFNRVIAGTYPPGSTVKPGVGAAALQEKIATPDTVIVDKGVLVVPNQFNPSLAYNFYGWKRSGLGPMNLASAIAESSDIYFYTIAGGYPNTGISGLGAEKLSAYLKKFGFGSITGIDIPGEKPGLVPDPEWKAEYFKNDDILSKWYLGNTYHLGIGQGDMLATPLQVANLTAVFANNGKTFKPNILNKIVDEKGKLIFQPKPEVLISNFVDQQNIREIQKGMRQTVLSGSAVQLKDLPISAAGKTGTSQFDGADLKKTHAWFTAYAPYEDPQIVLAILVEAGGEGHSVAVPVAKEVLKWWSENRLKN